MSERIWMCCRGEISGIRYEANFSRSVDDPRRWICRVYSDGEWWESVMIPEGVKPGFYAVELIIKSHVSKSLAVSE